MKVCSRCGHPYEEYPALSRVDNKTEICPDCGMREAMEMAGFTADVERNVMIRHTKAKYLPGMRVRLLKMDDK